MDLRQLKYFVQIVESGGFSKAARLFNVAQPALSQQIARLEEEVGKPLLHRTARGVTPTENGLALYHQARFTLRQLDQALKIARQEAGALRGMVSIGLPSTTLAPLGLPLVRAVSRTYPGILLNVVEGLSGHLAQMMRVGQLDLAVLFTANIATDLHAEPLIDEELFVIMPKDSPLQAGAKDTVTLAEAAALPLILPTGLHGLRRRIDAAFDARDLTPRVVAEIDSLSLLLDCVLDGVGATIKPMSALHLVRERSRWRALRVSDARLKRPNYLYSVSPERLSPAAAAVAEALRETTGLLVQSGAWSGVTLLGDG